MFSVKLSRIKTVASPQTKRKRDITANQLERQYRLIYNSVASDTPAVSYDILKVARWWGDVNVMARTIIEQSEPFTWLRHLDTRKIPVQQLHMPWHLNALIMEEYGSTTTTTNRYVDSAPIYYSGAKLFNIYHSRRLRNLFSLFVTFSWPKRSSATTFFPRVFTLFVRTLH